MATPTRVAAVVLVVLGGLARVANAAAIVARAGGAASATATGIAMRPDGTAVVVGHFFNGHAKFPGAPPSSGATLTSDGETDVFAAILSANGTSWQAAVRAGGAADDDAKGVVTRPTSAPDR